MDKGYYCKQSEGHMGIDLNEYELYKRIVNSSPHGIFLSCDGKFIYANKKALELLKIGSMDDLLSKNTIDIIHPKYRNTVASRRLSSIGEEFSLDTIEVQFICGDNSTIDVEMESTVFISGDKLLTLTKAKAITGRKEMQRKLLDREALINAIFDSTIDGILVVDDKGKIININNRLFEMWNISEEAFMGLDEKAVLGFILKGMEDPDRFKSIIDRAYSIVNEYFDNIRFSDGRVFNFYSCPLIIGGEITGRIWSFRDITRQAEAEEKLNKSNAELMDTIAKLKETQAQLIQKEKLAGIGQLAAGVAHEINNPLSYAVSNIGTLKKRIFSYKNIIGKYRRLADNAEYLSYESIRKEIRSIKELENKSNFSYIIDDLDDLIEDSLEGLHRVGRIVASLRDFSGKYEADRYENYNLNDGIESTLAIMESEIKFYAEVKKDLSDISSIKANGGQINYVLLNMLQNSVYAIKKKAGHETGVIRIKTYEKGRYVVCEIEDNGIGIEEKDINKIFLPFYTTKDVGEGCGLGLSTAFDIVTNKHKGDISVESIPSIGTKFIIRLPV